MSNNQYAPIAMAAEYWENSYFSIARHFGGVTAFGHTYTIVNKDGVTIFELSDPDSPHYVGDDAKAIEPGEPNDGPDYSYRPCHPVPNYKRREKNHPIRIRHERGRREMESINERRDNNRRNNVGGVDHEDLQILRLRRVS